MEQEYEADGRGWKSGMCAAVERLTEILAANGFANHEAFMHAMLREEMKSRQVRLREGGHETKFLQGRKEHCDSDAANAAGCLGRIYRHYIAVANHVNTLFARTDDCPWTRETMRTFQQATAGETGLFARLLSDGENRTGRRPHDFFRHAANEQALRAGASMGGHNNHVCLLGVC